MVAASEIANKYECNIYTLYSAIRNYDVPTRKNGGKLLVDIDYMLQKQKNNKSIASQAQDNYYAMLDAGYREYHIALLLEKETSYSVGAWLSFMHSTLFSHSIGASITKLFLPKKFEEFVRVTNKILTR